MSPEGAKLAPVENHCYRGSYPKAYGDMNAEWIYYEWPAYPPASYVTWERLKALRNKLGKAELAFLKAL